MLMVYKMVRPEWLLLLPLVVAYPDLEIHTCLTMDPFDSTLPQALPFPYDIITNRQGEIHNQDSVRLTIKAREPRTLFEQYLVQARDNRTGNAVGTFMDTGDAEMEPVNCFYREANTAREFDDEPKTQARMRWMPEFDYEGEVTFYATVVQTKEIFWLMQPGTTLRIYNPWNTTAAS